MERATARRGVLGISSSVLLALALLCFLMPFATVGCDQRATYHGVDFVQGDSEEFPQPEEPNSSEEDPGSVLSSGAAPITLAVVFAGLGVLLGLVPGLTAAAAAYAAAALAAGALAAFFLSGSLRGLTTLFVDFRYGFWPALALATAASLVARFRWQAAPRVVTGAPIVAGCLGVGFLAFAALAGQVTEPADDVEGNPDVTRGFPLAVALSPGSRRGEAWDGAVLAAVPFLAAAALLMLVRQPSRLAAWALIGLGAGWMLAGLQDVGYYTASNLYSVGDGTYLGLLGGAALIVAGLGGRPPESDQARGFGVPARVLVAVGATAAVAGTLVPFEKLGRENIALLHGGQGATRWLALQPIGLALLGLALTWVLPHARAVAALIGLSFALLAPYVALLSPLTAMDEDETIPMDAGAGALIGAAGALVILAGALLQLRQSSD